MDGSGKSTQIDFMKKFLQNQGREVLITREPGGTKIGEKLRQIILDKENKEMKDITEALLYAASRAQHVEEVIMPAIKKGKIVICDRFIDSSMVYQGIGRNLGYHTIKTINEFAIRRIIPDLTILFDISPEKSLKRINVQNVDRLEQEKIDFHRRVYKAYKQLASENQYRIKLIKANRQIEEIKKDVEQLLINLL